MENNTLYRVSLAVKKNYRALFFGLLCVLILFRLVGWYINTSIIEITSASPSSYTITSISLVPEVKKNGKTKDKASIRVKKGEYMVQINRSDESNSISYIKTKGLLSKTTVSQADGLVSSRKIVADSPLGCILSVKPILQTYTCNAEPLNGKNHIAATAVSPGYVTTIENRTSSAQYVGVVDFNDSRYVVAKDYNVDQPGSGLNLYPLVDGVPSVTGGRLLSNKEGEWKVSSTAKNLLIYDTAGAKAVLFDTSLATAKEFQLGLNNITGVSLVDVALHDDGIYYLESSFVGQEREGTEPVKQQSIISFTDFSGATSKSRVFTAEYSSIEACGENIVCALSGDRFDILSKTTNYSVLFSATGIQSIVRTGSKIYLESTRGVYVYDPSRAGAESIFFNSRIRMCGLFYEEGTLLGCAEDKLGRYLLKFSDGEQGVLAPDKLRLLLADQEFIKSASISRDIVYVTPNYGLFSYDEVLKEYRYSPEKIQSTKQQLESLVGETPNLTGYTIINTLQDLK